LVESHAATRPHTVRDGDLKVFHQAPWGISASAGLQQVVIHSERELDAFLYRYDILGAYRRSDLPKVERTEREILLSSLGVKRINWHEQMLVLVSDVLPARISQTFIDTTIDSLKVHNGVLAVHWTVTTTVDPVGPPFILLEQAAAVALVERFNGPVHFEHAQVTRILPPPPPGSIIPA
jgi:hypothetical protein